MRAKQFLPPSAGADLVIFDIDDTLLHTTAKIKVVDDTGNVVRELTNQEFNQYELQPGEEFDFGEFRDAQKFNQESKPIKPMVRKLKTILKSAGNAKVIMLTARADFDDKHTFLKTFADLGIDMSRVHVHRAGNLPGNDIPAEKKAVWVRRYLDTGRYGHVRLYDDSMSNLRVFKELKTEYPSVDFRAIYVGPSGSTQVVEDQDDYEIKNYEKLDKILSKLCALVVEGQKTKPEYYGKVAAAVLDPDNNLVARLNYPTDKGRVHAERAAMEAYEQQYGDIPEGSIVLTTLSPCSEHMTERDGPSCTDYINDSVIKKVYCGYQDPTQDEDQRQFNILESRDSDIRDICKTFAETFIHGTNEDYSSDVATGPEFKPTMPAGTVRVDVSDVYDWYKLGKNVSNLKRAKPSEFGKGPPSTIMSFGSEPEEHKYINDLKKLGLTTTDIDPLDPNQPKSMPRQKTDPTYNVGENFADGKNPQDKGDSKRHGINTKASVSSLRKTAKQGGRKGQLAHWLANMKAGRKK